MWLRMRITDLKVVSHYTGLFIIGIGLTMLVPLITAVMWAEWSAVLDYVLGIGVAFAVGGAMRLSLAHEVRVTRAQALALVAFAWVAASAVGAVPLAVSGEFGSYLDAMFETVSGFTTSGLTLAADLDHMPNSHNMWRHLTHFIGGQGIIVAALSISVGMRGGAFSLYQAEGRDERIMPNVLHTARFIWIVAVTYILLGTVFLGGIGLWLGMSVDRFPACFLDVHGCIRYRRFCAANDEYHVLPQSRLRVRFAHPHDWRDAQLQPPRSGMAW
jgi:trk system potassium uptake protein TrkH